MILLKNSQDFAVSQVDLKSKQRQLEYTLQEDNVEDRKDWIYLLENKHTKEQF